MDAPQSKTMAIDTERRSCDVHGEYEARRIINTRFTHCPQCAEAERQATEQRNAAEKKARADAARAQRINVLLAESGLVGRQLRSTFETYQARDPRQQAVLATCQAYMEQFVEGKAPPTNSLWLLGNPGTGKSHLGAAMVNHIITTSARAARMHSGQEIIRMLRSTWNRDKPAVAPVFEENDDGSCRVTEPVAVTEDSLIRDIANCKLLVLDEIGVGHGSNSEHVQLFEVLDLRYKLEKPTVLLSNLAPTALKAALGDRVYDRLREGATIKACDWKSHRGEFPTRAGGES